MATLAQTFGIVLPIAHGPEGFFNQSHDAAEQIKSNIMMLLLTKKGERRMNPEFGSSLWSVLFENVDNIVPLIESTIRKDITRWMNYVNISSINVDTNPKEIPNNHSIKVKVEFTVPSLGINRIQAVDVALKAGKI